MVTVRVPATIANLGPAFDALGIAVSLYNTVELELTPGPRLKVHGEGEGELPLDERRLVYRAATVVAAECGRSASFDVRCRNDIPLARGLGSSAATIVGGMVVANTLLGRPLDDDVLLRLAAGPGRPSRQRGSRTRRRRRGLRALVRRREVHAAAAGMAGCACRRGARLRGVRERGPRRLPHRVAGAGRTGLLAHAMDDTLHRPYRRPLVPGVDAVFAAARRAGAYGAALAGSGPSIVALAPSDRAGAVGGAMVEAPFGLPEHRPGRLCCRSTRRARRSSSMVI